MSVKIEDEYDFFKLVFRFLIVNCNSFLFNWLVIGRLENVGNWFEILKF